MVMYPPQNPLDPSTVTPEMLADWESRLDVSRTNLVGEEAAKAWISLYTAYQNAKNYKAPVIIEVPVVSVVPPTVRAGNDVTITDADVSGSEVVTLTGLSTVAESIVSRTWAELPNGNIIGNADTVSVSVAAGTTKSFRYTATTSSGATASDDVTVTVNNGVVIVDPPAPSAGWSALPDPLATKIYVDKSGNDTTGNGTATKPYATLAKVKSVATAGSVIYIGPGVWNETSWTLSGASATKPTVIMGWPGKERPVFTGTPGFGIKIGAVINNLWLVDIVFRNNNGTGTYPLDFLCTGTNIRIEGCLITGGSGLRVQAYPSGRFTNFTLFRTIIANCADYNGVYFESVDNLIIDSSYVHDNGGVGDIRKQGCYIHQSCGPATVVNSFFSMNCAGGLQQRPGGTCTDCFGYKNPINFQMGHGETNLSGVDNVRGPYKATGTISNCVAYDSDNIGASNPRGMAYWLANCVNLICDNNIAMNQVTGSYPIPFLLTDGATSATIKNCLAYKWVNASEAPIQTNAGTLTQQNNDVRFAQTNSNPGTSYPDPNRSILTLCTVLGITASETSFINDMLLQSKARWKSALEAKNINKYLRAGFGR